VHATILQKEREIMSINYTATISMNYTTIHTYNKSATLHTLHTFCTGISTVERYYRKIREKLSYSHCNLLHDNLQPATHRQPQRHYNNIVITSLASRQGFGLHISSVMPSYDNKNPLSIEIHFLWLKKRQQRGNVSQ